MRLNKLILHGFKSFADRTEFVFDSPITGIVGPNGCGKSNVVDGFKWVLGEQSAKSLRGDAMLDVLFNGSGGRKPSGMAEVVLIFDNPRRADGTRMLGLDVDELTVGRRLFRDGTSEYQVNNQPSRLKDIRELFLDTGIGMDAYSVIEQGRIELLLQSNPQERRLIFEEAAGISKYKAKKKEAQRKLERVDQNLLRVHDIVEEVEKRLRSVKVQAGRARTFQEHSQRLRELRLTYALQEYHTHHKQYLELEKKREDAQFRLDDITADLARAQNELAARRQEHEALSQTRQRVEYESVQAEAAMQSARQRQQYAAQQLQQIAEQLAQFDVDRQGVEEKLAAAAAAFDTENLTLGRLAGELERQQSLIAERQQGFRDGQLQLNGLNQQIEQTKSAQLDLMRKLAQVNSALGAIDINRRNIAAQQTRLAERRRIVVEEIEKLEAGRVELQQKLEAALALVAQRQSQFDGYRQDAAALGKQISEISEQLGFAREHRSGLLSRQKLLEDLESRREGVSEGVKSILRQREEKFPFIRGLVADVLRVDVEHALVIEAALDGRDQLLVTRDSAAALAAGLALEDLEGRASILCTDRVPAFDDGYDWNQHAQGVRLAIDLVRFDADDASVALHLLGRTVVVDDLLTAGELSHAGPRGYRYVTKAGEVIEADGTLRAGPLTAAMGLLSRRSELEALTQQIAEVDSRIAALSARLSDGNAQAKALEEMTNSARNSIYQANTIKVELTSQVAQNADKQSSLRREQPVLDRELQGLLEQMGRLKTDESKLAEQKQIFETDQADKQQQVEEMIASQKQTAENLRAWGEELTAARVQLGQVQEKHLAARQQVERLESARTELTQQIERLVKSAEAVASRRGSVESELEQAKKVEAALISKGQELRAQLESLVARVGEASGVVTALAGQVESVRGAHAEVEGELHALQIKAGEGHVRLELLVQRAMDELQLDVPARYAEFSADGGAGYQPAEMDWDAVAAEIKELREKIQRLGNVNVEAINEQQELETREQFLSTQVNDLTESKRQLEELIDQINSESAVRFEQTFNAVREHFQGMFRKLFGGGKADIFLETELEQKPVPIDPNNPEAGMTPSTRKVDILDAGIEIIARPPGKQPVSISQLSGGEKTMTCVALLMSIFKSKPSPFCILDEVDAALDEANNQRFNLIVQEFLEQSQFIVITHSKRTMQIADVLYGVTMQEQGVSKRVAVKFDQVDGQGRISETAAA